MFKTEIIFNRKNEKEKKDCFICVSVDRNINLSSNLPEVLGKVLSG